MITADTPLENITETQWSQIGGVIHDKYNGLFKWVGVSREISYYFEGMDHVYWRGTPLPWVKTYGQLLHIISSCEHSGASKADLTM